MYNFIYYGYDGYGTSSRATINSIALSGIE